MDNFNLKKYIEKGGINEAMDYTGGVSFDDDEPNTNEKWGNPNLKGKTVLIHDITEYPRISREVKITSIALEKDGHHQIYFDDESDAIFFYGNEWEEFLKGDEVTLHPDEVMMQLKIEEDDDLNEDFEKNVRSSLKGTPEYRAAERKGRGFELEEKPDFYQNDIKSLIDKGIEVINDKDEYATLDWKYGELEDIILKIKEQI